jgi:hypothetical protein
MATSKVDIWNMAVGLCGNSSFIAAEDETTVQANVCRVWYDTVRRSVIKRAPWGCALNWADLAVLSERDFGQRWTSSAPGPGWRFAYGAPPNMLNPFHLFSYNRFEMALHNGAPAIMANEENAILRYVQDQENVEYWEEGLVEAVASLLAFKISPKINAKLGQRDRLAQDAYDLIGMAQDFAANASDAFNEKLPEEIVARGYSNRTDSHKHFYTFQNLNVETA